MREITVNYNGSYPTLCFGEWNIIIEDVNLTYTESMGTFGNYGNWCFGEDYIEEWEYDTEGLDSDEWLSIGRGKEILSDLKLHNIILTEEEQKQLYLKVQDNDWRHNSCGGCI